MFDFWHFKKIDLNQYYSIPYHYDILLVVISIIVAVLAAFSILIILDRIWNTKNKQIVNSWIVFGSVVMGLGVWAMHFTGMLAYKMPINMTFTPFFTAISVIPIIVGTFISLKILAKRNFTFINIQLSALSLAAAIGAMHFTGMEAMESESVVHYDIYLFIQSIILAFILATVTLYLIVIKDKIHKKINVARFVCAVAMGATVTSMHYTAMSSVTYYVSVNTPLDVTLFSQHSLALPMIIVTIMILLVALTIIGSLIDKRLQFAEKAALESEIRERDILENLPDGLIIVNSVGEIVSINTTAIKMFGLTNTKSNDDSLLNVQQLLPSIDSQDLVTDLVAKEPIYLGQTVIINGTTHEGGEFPIEANFSKMSLIIKSQHTFSCVLRDITERVTLEKQLNQALKLESIGQLAAGIAHEINTPVQYVNDNTVFLKTAFEDGISVIQHCLKLSNKDIDSITEEDMTKLKSLVEEADFEFLTEEIPLSISQSLEGLERISSIIKAMKSFSHSSQGEINLTNINEAIETTTIVARSEWRYIAELETTFDDSIPSVMCYRDEINQVILNIIVNAAHAIEEHAVESGLITISTKLEGEFVVISISDNGVGMSSETKERIFDHFFTTKDVGKGTGQGLSLAYSIIVEHHNGKIEVESELRQGTTFNVFLPIDRQTTESSVSDALINPNDNDELLDLLCE